MKYYFLLLFKMLNREIKEFGISPVLAYPLALAAFIGFSLLLFSKTGYAGYIYIVVALMPVARFSETRRNDFLRTCFQENSYYLTRIIENTLIVLPYCLFLVFRLQFLLAGLLTALAMFLALTSFSGRSGFSVPTPFGKKPFEFTVGFRSTFIIIILAYFIAVMSITANNFNLGIAALVLVFLVCYTFYLNPENEFYIWVFSLSPGPFILEKIKTAMLFSTYLTTPVIIALLLHSPDKLPVIAMFHGLGYLFLIAVILAKYASYPYQISVPQFIILAVSVWFPPLLIAAIPFFYIRSVTRLKELLV